MPVTRSHRHHPRRGDVCSARHGSGRSRDRAGFTLVELLVVVAIGGLVFSGAVVLLLSHLRTSARLASLQHLQDHCGWVQFLINREIEQASAASGGGNTLILAVPGYSRPVTITYTRNQAGELQRIGPAIAADGRLVVPEDPNDPDAPPRTDLVARDVQAFVVTIDHPRAPRYQLTLRDASGTSYTLDRDPADPGGAGRGVGAYCRAQEITRSDPTPPPPEEGHLSRRHGLTG